VISSIVALCSNIHVMVRHNRIPVYVVFLQDLHPEIVWGRMREKVVSSILAK
jgi:hypothetical protein